MTAETLRDDLRRRGLLPHQIEFIETAIGSGSDRRVLLEDDIGLGKTRGCIALVWAWREVHGRRPRAAILAPRALHTMWQDELADFASVDAELVDAARYRRFEARTRADETPWRAVETVVTTVDFLKRDDRLSGFLRSPWDIVIMDEAHHATEGSKSGRVLRTLWTADTVKLMVAASAIPGRLLNRLSASPGKTTRVLRRHRGNIVDWSGEPIFRPLEQQVEIIQLQFSSEERHLLETTSSLLRERSIGQHNRRFLASLYIRAATSSLLCFGNILRRALVRADLQAVEDSSAVLSDDDALDTVEVAVRSPLARDDLRRLVALTDLVEVDTKGSACARLLHLRLADFGGSGVIFCDFADTARYVAGLVAGTGISTKLITGGMKEDERYRALASFRQSGGVLVLTSAVAEGLELSSAKLWVHYDVPWSSNALVKRLARVDRVGAPPGPVRHVAFADEILMRVHLVEKLFSIPDAGTREDAEVFRRFWVCRAGPWTPTFSPPFAERSRWAPLCQLYRSANRTSLSTSPTMACGSRLKPLALQEKDQDLCQLGR